MGHPALLYFLVVVLCGQLAAGELSGADTVPPAQTIVNSIGLKLVRIPAGEFLMGSDKSDPGARADELPQHRVRISRSFYLGVYEVTQAEFQQLMQTNPSSFTRARLLKWFSSEFRRTI